MEVFDHLQKTFPRFKELSLGGKSCFANLSSFELCGKMAVLHKLMTSLLSKGDKILLFSHSTKVRLLKHFLKIDTCFSIVY